MVCVAMATLSLHFGLVSIAAIAHLAAVVACGVAFGIGWAAGGSALYLLYPFICTRLRFGRTRGVLSRFATRFGSQGAAWLRLREQCDAGAVLAPGAQLIHDSVRMLSRRLRYWASKTRLEALHLSVSSDLNAKLGSSLESVNEVEVAKSLEWLLQACVGYSPTRRLVASGLDLLGSGNGGDFDEAMVKARKALVEDLSWVAKGCDRPQLPEGASTEPKPTEPTRRWRWRWWPLWR